MEIKLSKLSKIKQNFTCQNCDKTFQTNAGLWKHKKTCDNKEEKTINNEVIIKDEPTDKDLIMMLIKQNTELMELKSYINQFVGDGIMNLFAIFYILHKLQLNIKDWINLYESKQSENYKIYIKDKSLFKTHK